MSVASLPRAAVPLDALPFELQPFGGAAERSALGLAALALQGAVWLRRSDSGALLNLSMALQGLLPAPFPAPWLPPPAPSPGRRDGLWQHTCFELFLAPLEGAAYWELNLSPSGDWAVYRFDGYRSGQTSPCLEPPPFELTRRPTGLRLELRWPLPTELATVPALRVGVTTVLEQIDGTLSYWALQHPGPEPDFHRCDSFSLRL